MTYKEEAWYQASQAARAALRGGVTTAPSGGVAPTTPTVEAQREAAAEAAAELRGYREWEVPVEGQTLTEEAYGRGVSVPSETEVKTEIIKMPTWWKPTGTEVGARPVAPVPTPFAYGPPSPYRPITEQQRQQRQYEKYISERKAVAKAAETWQAKLGHALSYEQIGGLKTAYEVIEQPILAYIQVKRKKGFAEPTYYWSEDYQKALKRQYGKLSEQWRERRIERTRMAFFEPKEFAIQEAAGIGITTGALLLPKVLPAAGKAVVARAPAGFVSLAKVPVGVALATYGAYEIRKGAPKVLAGVPSSTLQVLTGVSLTTAGTFTAVTGGAEWLRWRGTELMKMPKFVEYEEFGEIKIWRSTAGLSKAGLKKWQFQAKFGRGLYKIGEVPVKIKEFFRPPTYEYYTREVKGFETIPAYKKERTGILLETAKEYAGGRVDYGQVIGGKWYPSGVSFETRATAEGTKLFITRPIEYAGYKGLPKAIKSFDVIGYYGGEMKIPAKLEFDMPGYILETKPTLLAVKKATVSEKAFRSLIERYPQKMFRITGMKTYVGATKYVGKAPTFLELMPEGAEAKGLIVTRFVKGPRAYKPFVFKAPPKTEIEAAYLRKVFLRAYEPERGLKEAIFKFEAEQLKIKMIGPGEGIRIGVTKAGKEMIVSGGAPSVVQRYEPVSVPLYTARMLAPGEPAIAVPGAISLGVIALKPLKRKPTIQRAEPVMRIMPKLKPKLRPLAQPRIIPKIEPKVVPLIEPKAKIKALPKLKMRIRPMVKPKVKPRVRVRVQPQVKQLIQPLVQPRPVPIPRIVPVIIPTPKPRKVKRVRRKKGIRLPRKLKGRQGKVAILPKADWLSLTQEEMKLRKKAKHPPITFITEKEFLRRLHGPRAAILRFPTARQFAKIMKEKRKKIKKTKFAKLPKLLRKSKNKVRLL